MPIAGDDRLYLVRSRKRYEVVIVWILGEAGHRRRIIDANGTLGDQRYECLTTTVRRGSFELRPAQHSRELGEQQWRNKSFDLAVE